jgi:hypothetical protein
LFIVLKVAGANTTASAAGSSSGIRHPEPGPHPMPGERGQPGGVDEPLAHRRGDHPEQPSCVLGERMNSSTLDAAGAPHTITYGTFGDLSCTLINRERSSPALLHGTARISL